MPRVNTPKFGFGYGWNLGENPGTQPLDDMRLTLDAAVKTDFSYDPVQSNGLNYFYFGGNLFDQYGQINFYAAGYVTLADNSTNYIYRTGPSVTSNTTGFLVGCSPMAVVVTVGGYITSVTDARPTEISASQLLYKSSNIVIGSNSVGAALDQIGEYLKILLGGLRRSYVFTQTSALSTWVINHNLNQYPTVMILDDAENVLLAEIDYTSLNTITVSFSSPQSGTANLIYAVSAPQMVFEQTTAVSVWTVIHNLGVDPLVDLTDLSGNVITGGVEYVNANTIRITFSSPTTGRAYLRL